jgi:peptidyl-prolyl cis-trans isomerase D
MLQRMRDRIKGWVATVIIGLLSIPFMLWGVNSYFNYADTEWVAKVGDRTISVAEFRNEHQQQLARFQQILGEQFQAGMFDSPRARDQLVERMVRQVLLEDRTRELGYRIGDQQLAEEIQKLDVFQVAGKFSREMMKQRLEQARMSPAVFDARLRQDMLGAQLPDAIAKTDFVTPRELARSVALADERRSATWLAVPAVRFLPDIQVTDADVEAWYQANQARFATEEKVSLDYLVLEREPSGVPLEEPTDEQLQDLYDQESDRFRQPEQRRAAHILVPIEGDDVAAAEAKAAALAARVAKGEDFAALARAESSDPGSAQDGGALGWIERGTMTGPFEDALFAMAAGEVRAPVRTEFGVHVIRLEEVRAEQAKPLAEVRDELAAEWRERQVADRFERASERLADLVYSNADSLAPAAEALGLQVQRVADVTRSGGAAVAADAAVRDAAFSPEVLEQGRNSVPLSVDGVRLVVIRVADHQPASVRPFAEVAARARDALRDERASAAAKQFAEQLAVRMREGAIPEVLAKQERLPPPITGTLRRRGDAAPPEVLRALFQASKPAGAPVTGTVRLGNGDQLAFRLEAVASGDVASLSEPERASRAADAAQRNGTLALIAYSDALEKAADVRYQKDKAR